MALAKILYQDPAVLDFNQVIEASGGGGGGGGSLSSGRFFIVLKGRSDGDVSARGFIDRLRPKMAHVPGIIRLTIDRAAAARHGLSVDDINQVL
jgi:multidrug efflux pump subunit AcrB